METSLHRLVRGRAGLRVIGDVHGMAEDFAAAVHGAIAANLAVCVLGDIIDYGNDSPRCMEIAHAIVRDGAGIIVPGNHDAKFLRWIRGHRINIKPEGLGETIRQLRAHPNGIGISHRFAETMAAMPIWQTVGDRAFVHAGFHPEMIGRNGQPIGNIGRPDRIANLALNGETYGDHDDDGKNIRTYGWAKLIPEGMTVYIGHDVISKEKIVMNEEEGGGTVAHMDTGSGEGGRLSWMDIDADEMEERRRGVKRRRGGRGRGRRDDRDGTKPAT